MPDEEPDRQALLTVLTTEHFGLQGARASTISESASRAALFVGAVSSALVALGFLGQGERGAAFDTFALVVLPTLYALGVFTFARLVESSVEDMLYGRAINRIRQFYEEVAGPAGRRYLLLGAHDDPRGVLANMGIANPSRWQLLFTLATMVMVLDMVVGGSAVAFAAGVLGAPLGLAVAAGAVAALASLAAFSRWQRAVHDRGREVREVLRPSPP